MPHTPSPTRQTNPDSMVHLLASTPRLASVADMALALAQRTSDRQLAKVLAQHPQIEAAQVN